MPVKLFFYRMILRRRKIHPQTSNQIAFKASKQESEQEMVLEDLDDGSLLATSDRTSPQDRQSAFIEAKKGCCRIIQFI